MKVPVACAILVVFSVSSLPAPPAPLGPPALPAPPALPGPPAQPARPAPPAPQKRPPLFPAQDLGLIEAPDRDEWQKPDLIMDKLRIADGSSVGEVGAGGGWFTMRLARRVG